MTAEQPGEFGAEPLWAVAVNVPDPGTPHFRGGAKVHALPPTYSSGALYVVGPHRGTGAYVRLVIPWSLLLLNPRARLVYQPAVLARFSDHLAGGFPLWADQNEAAAFADLLAARLRGDRRAWFLDRDGPNGAGWVPDPAPQRLIRNGRSWHLLPDPRGFGHIRYGVDGAEHFVEDDVPSDPI